MRDTITVRLQPVDPELGTVEVHATLPPDITLQAEAEADGSPVALAIAGALLRAVAETAPGPVADAARNAVDALDEGLAPWIGHRNGEKPKPDRNAARTPQDRR